MKKRYFIILFISFSVLLLYSGQQPIDSMQLTALGCAASPDRGTGTMQLTSPAFQENEKIPAKYTCEGANISPPLEISGVPGGTQSLALIMEDPDAPTGAWIHWIVFNINPGIDIIAEDSVPQGAIQGANSWDENKYGGPCPPPGSPHRYVFKLYALDTNLQLGQGAEKSDVESAMQNHIMSQTTLTGLYSRE